MCSQLQLSCTVINCTAISTWSANPHVRCLLLPALAQIGIVNMLPVEHSSSSFPCAIFWCGTQGAKSAELHFLRISLDADRNIMQWLHRLVRMSLFNYPTSRVHRVHTKLEVLRLQEQVFCINAELSNSVASTCRMPCCMSSEWSASVFSAPSTSVSEGSLRFCGIGW